MVDFILLSWLDNLVEFPADYEFIKYCIIGVIIVLCVALAYGFFGSTFSAVFNRR